MNFRRLSPRTISMNEFLNQRTRNTLIIFLCLLTVTVNAGEISFNQSIRPILSDKCFHCHGPDEKHIKGKLQLHNFEAATKNLSRKSARHAIVPGNPGKSTLWQRINTADSDDIMPPPESHKNITQQEKELIRKWIEEGAAYEKHWAFREIPEFKEATEIDVHFTGSSRQGFELQPPSR